MRIGSALEFELSMLSGGAGNPWRRWIDTSLDTRDDIVEWQAAPSISGGAYRTGTAFCGRACSRILRQQADQPKGRGLTGGYLSSDEGRCSCGRWT